MPNSVIEPLAPFPKRSEKGEFDVVARAASEMLQSTVGDGDFKLSYGRRRNGVPVLACEVTTNLCSHRIVNQHARMTIFRNRDQQGTLTLCKVDPDFASNRQN